LLAPAGTPPLVIEKLSKAIDEAIKSEDFARQMKSQGMEILSAGPEDFALRIKGDIARWDAVLQATGLGK
jgi:tripartite-type tricarboxylate transporter receptor subunit TctC